MLENIPGRLDKSLNNNNLLAKFIHKLTLIIMKKALFILAFALFTCFTFGQEQEEGISTGDMELSFNGMVFTTVGTDYSTTYGNIFVSFGRYFTKRLLVGVAPGLTLSTQEGDINVDASLQIFSGFNFVVNKKTIPYARVSFYQSSIDFITEGSEFLDASIIQGGLGLKMYFSDYAAWDTSLNAGYSLADSSEGVTLMFLTGITFKF